MAKIDINISDYTDNFWIELDEKCNFKQIREEKSCKELRVAKFNELLLEINQEDSEVQPFLRLTLCSKFIEECIDLCDQAKAIDYKEIADYIIAVIDDIKNAAANDHSISVKHHNEILCSSDSSFFYHIIHAIVEHCADDVMLTYMYNVVNIFENRFSPERITNYFKCVIHEYFIKKDYPSMVDFGRWFFHLFNKKNYDKSGVYTRSFQSAVESIHHELDEAFKALDINDEHHENMMAEIRKKEAAEARKEEDDKIKGSMFDNIKNTSTKRIAKFEESLKTIEDRFPEEQSYLKVKLCYTYLKAIFKQLEAKQKIDYKELAGYLSAVISDIEHVAANNDGFHSIYLDILCINNLDHIYCITEAIIGYLPHDYVHRFIQSVVSVKYNERKLYNIIRYFKCVINKYIDINNYIFAADYGTWFIKTYNKRVYNYTALEISNFEDVVFAIHKDIDKAYKVLGEKNKHHENMMETIKKRESETPKERNDRMKAELYDLAMRCQANGDMAGYCGYMSALSDIGR